MERSRQEEAEDLPPALIRTSSVTLDHLLNLSESLVSIYKIIIGPLWSVTEWIKLGKMLKTLTRIWKMCK